MKNKTLFILFYVLYTISFAIPSYIATTFSFGGGGSDIWFGWKCAAAAFALIFTSNSIIGVFYSLPNILMIMLLFIYKKVNIVLLFIFLIISFLSCSYWWIVAISKNEISKLLPGYWLWLLSITGGIIILIVNRKASIHK